MREARVAIIDLGGRQHLVKEGAAFMVNRLTHKIGEKLQAKDLLSGLIVELEVKAALRGPKIDGLKFKNKTRYLRRYGHRQALTKLVVCSINPETRVKTASKTKIKKTNHAKVKK